MPAFAPITINDGQGSPAAHTFAPRSEDPSNVWNHADPSSVASIGDNVLKSSLKFPTGGASAGKQSSAERVVRAQLSLALPILESTSASTGSGIAPAPTVAYVCRANVEYIIPERCTLQDRKNLNAFVKNALAHAFWKAQAEDMQAIY